MTSTESEVFSDAQQERIRQLIEANRPPPSSSSATSSSQDLLTAMTATPMTLSTAGNLGKSTCSSLCLNSYLSMDIKGKGPRASGA